jgi:hypothetical protein
MSRRFLRWQGRHPELAPSLARARERAEVLEREVCDEAGLAPRDVHRLRWVDAAMTRARTPKHGTASQSSGPRGQNRTTRVGSRATS